MSERNRIIVTGGAGFVGSHLCDRLLEGGHTVVCVDNFHTGRRENVDHLLDHSNFEIVEHDVAVPFYLDADKVYNLACPASPEHYQDDPIRTMKTSVFGAFNVLDLAKRSGSRILQASTSEVYGDPIEHPQHESYNGNVNPIGPRACYDEGKRCAETLFFDFHRQHGIEIKVARIFNTYGPRMQPNDGRVVSNFIVQALCGRPITIYGEGAQTRSFCYVDDLVSGLVALMDSPSDLHGPFNLGNPGEFTVRELAELVIDLTGTSSEIVYCPLPADDPRQRRPNIDHATSELGWKPEVCLRDGLVRTISYFDALLKAGTHEPDAAVQTSHASAFNGERYKRRVIKETGAVEEAAPIGK